MIFLIDHSGNRNFRCLLRVVGHLPWLLACCELGWAGVGQASGEETAGGLRSVFLQMWSMEI